jgi:uncharacterized membrane protein YvbJ
MYCQNCGKKNPDGAKFCYNCGIDLSGQPSAPKSIIVKEKKFDLSQLSLLTVIFVIVMSALALIGSFFTSVIILVVSYLLAVYAINNMTYKINASVNWAFAIIMSFGLIGYICYWVWYLHRYNVLNS